MARRSQPSTDSSPTSFYSSKEEDSELTSKSTTASTPTTSSPCQYRTARELPHELKEHCQIFLEEQLCMHTYVTPPLLPRSFPLIQSVFAAVLTFLVTGRHLRHQPSQQYPRIRHIEIITERQACARAAAEPPGAAKHHRRPPAAHNACR